MKRELYPCRGFQDMGHVAPAGNRKRPLSDRRSRLRVQNDLLGGGGGVSASQEIKKGGM